MTLVGTCVLGASSLLVLRYGLWQWHFYHLYQYQMRKLEDIPEDNTGILLLGDSSLGNAISADHWQEALGRPVTSLALTGVYGYAGSFNVLRRVLRRGAPELVVLMNTGPIMMKKVSHHGLLYSAETIADFRDAPGLFIFTALVNLDLPWQFVITAVFGRPPAPPGMAEWDYVPQGPPISVARDLAAFPVDKINHEKTFYLKKIAALCRDNGIRCVFMHGPYVEPTCSQSRPYFEETGRIIASTGIEVVDTTPVCIAKADIGDSRDHVGKPHRVRYSQTYLDRLQNYLE